MTKRGLDHPDPTGDARREPAKSEGASGDTAPRPQSEEESTDQSASAGAPDPLDALLARLADAPEQDVDSSPPRRLEPGARVARYQVVRELGRGGFGVVYEARDGDLGRHVALKALRPDRLGRGGASGAKQRSLRLSLLQQEAEMVARLQHPNIVTLFDLVLQDGLPYLVLELLSGETLQAALARGPLAPSEAMRHRHPGGARPCARARGGRDPPRLEAEQRLPHPRRPGQAAQSGPGARLAGDALLPRAGTPGFMAPEQWRGAEDERSDVYGAGLLLHAMLGGRVPHAFSGTGSLPRSELESQSRASRESAHPHAVLEVPASAPPDLAQLILRCCAADPAHRPQSARKLLDELLAFQRNTPLSPLSPLLDGPQTPQLAQPTRPAPAPHHTRRSMRIVGLLLVLFIMCLTPWMSTHHEPPEAPAAHAPPPIARRRCKRRRPSARPPRCSGRGWARRRSCSTTGWC